MTTAIPVNGDGTFDDPTWGESGGPFSVPADEANGIGSVALPSNTLNYEWQHQSRWLRALRDRMVLSDDGLYTNCIVRAGTWNTGAATLDGTLGVSRMIIDADDKGGVMVEVTVPTGSPHTFTASRDTYVNVNEAGALEFQAVTIGDPAPTPSAGYVAVWLVVTDGTELVSATELVPPNPVFLNIAAVQLGAGQINTSGNVGVGGTLGVTGASTLTGAVTCGSTLTVSGVTQVNNTFSVINQNPATLSGNVVLGTTSGGDFLTCHATAQFNENATFAKNVVVNGNTTLGDGMADLLTVVATSTFQNNVTLGSSSADTLTVNATVGSDIDMGLNSIIDADMITVDSQVDADYGVYIVPKSTAPVHAPLRLGVQFSDPSSGTSGSLSSSGLRGVLRYFSPTLAAWQSIHQSPKGLVEGFTAGTDDTIINSGNLASTTISAEETGTVLVEATGVFSQGSATSTFDLVIRDVTAGTTIASATIYTAVASEPVSETLRVVYTLPNTGNRVFAMQVNGNGATSVTRTNCVLSVRGVR